MSDGYTFNQDAVERIRRTVKRVEAMPLTSGPGERGPVTPLCVGRNAKTWGSVPAFTVATNTPGKGKAVLWIMGDTSMTQSDPVDVYNMGATIPDGQWVTLALRDGKWFISSTLFAGKAAGTTSVIGAMAGTTAGQGAATLYTASGGALASSGQSVTVYNMGSTTIPAGKWVLLMLVDSYYYVVAVPC